MNKISFYFLVLLMVITSCREKTEITSAIDPSRPVVQEYVSTYSAVKSYPLHDKIDVVTWDDGGEISRYAFLHMSQFFPAAMIHKGDKTEPFLETINPKIGQILVSSGKDTLSLEKYLEKIHINSFIILHKGNVIFEKYYNMLKHEKHSLQSTTKPFAGTLIAFLEKQGLIDIEEGIEHYIVELKDTEWAGVKIKHILNMQSGMEGADEMPDAFINPETVNYKLESALGFLPVSHTTPTSVYGFISQLKRVSVPGSDIEYNNVNSVVLGWLAERVTDKRLSELITEKIWQPMGAEWDAYICTSNKGIPLAHGGMSTTLRDLARFGNLFTLSNIKQRKEEIISRDFLEKLYESDGLPYQWDFASREKGMMKRGWGGNELFVKPERDIVIAFFNYPDEDWEIFHNLYVTIEQLLQSDEFSEY